MLWCWNDVATFDWKSTLLPQTCLIFHAKVLKRRHSFWLEINAPSTCLIFHAMVLKRRRSFWLEINAPSTIKKKLHNLANEENVAKWKGPNYSKSHPYDTIVRIWTEIFKFNKSSVISTGSTFLRKQEWECITKKFIKHDFSSHC